jgi:hypothetical protein
VADCKAPAKACGETCADLDTDPKNCGGCGVACTAPSGGTVSIPVFVRDSSGTPLGIDSGFGNRIQGVALKVTYPTEVIASIAFTRADVTAGITP